MKLHFRRLGSGKPLVVLHGVFGSSDNLYSVCKSIAEQGYEVFIVDARNHGQSGRSSTFNYAAMAEDLDLFLAENNIENSVLLGHSMGGKTVLYYSQHYSNFSGLVVVDIAPKAYVRHHDYIIQGLQAIDLGALTSRREAEAIFSQHVTEVSEQQFLLKNLYRTDAGGFDWRLNVPALADNLDEVVAEIAMEKVVEQPLLLMRGAASAYVDDRDFDHLQVHYPQSRMETVQGAGHWIHASHPAAFVAHVIAFLREVY